MGCDIHAFMETRTGNAWQYAGNVFPDNEYPDSQHDPFNSARDYGLFGFLADVRNYSQVPVITPPRGLPADVSAELRSEHDEFNDYHSASWLTLAELLAFNYDQTFPDQRTKGDPEVTTVRDFLGEWYFGRLALLSQLGAPENVRIVFCFDN